MTPIREAMVLAAGKGTRMAPLTDTRPKPMVEVAGKALIDHMLDLLKGAGVTRAVVNVHHLAPLLIAHLAGRADLEIVTSDETAELLETGGGTAKALPLFRDEVFFYVNTDALLIDPKGDALARLMAAFDPARMDALMLLADVTRAPGYAGTGDFHLNADGRLARKEKGGTAPFVWTTIQIVSRALFEDAPQGKFSTNLLWDRAIAKGRLYGQVFDGEWLEVNDPQAAARADARLRQGM